MSSFLTGIRVVDLSRILAGPWASQMLADLGATVWKIEKPHSGDDTRHWGPPFISPSDDSSSDAAYFLCANRGKKSVCINFKKPEGAQLLRRMVKNAHIVIENFKKGDLARYGLGYADLKAIAPHLVYCSITGFGQTGPDAQRSGYDFIVQAMGGLMSITGHSRDQGGMGPVKTGVAVADLNAGLYAASAILAALRKAETSGVGCHIDVSLFDCQLAMLANQAANYLIGGREPQLGGNTHPNIVPYQTFACADRDIVLAVGNDRQFATLCKLLGREELAQDPRFCTNAQRVRQRAALSKTIANILKHRNASEWVALFLQHSIPAGPLNSVAEAFNEPSATARSMRQTLHRTNGDAYEQVPYPVKFRDNAVNHAHAAPLLGEHTDAVLKEQGLCSEELSSLRKRGIVA